MSRENVEIVRRVHDAANRRDAAAVYALYDTEVELDASRVEIAGFTARDLYRGHEGLRRFFREWHEAWENVTYDFEELIDRRRRDGRGDQARARTGQRRRREVAAGPHLEAACGKGGAPDLVSHAEDAATPSRRGERTAASLER